MAIEEEVLGQLLEGRDPNKLFAKDGLPDGLKKTLSGRILNAGLDEYLEGAEAQAQVNRHIGVSRKTALTGTSKLTIAVPRGRSGNFHPKLTANPRLR